jgi:extracellular factor (EF) 3-hydroxypalmitic acid methyl ester biosynthesis protein
MYKTKTNQIPVEIVNFLTSLVDKGGPEPNDYNAFTEIVNNLSDEELEIFRNVIKESLNEQTLIGHGFVKPFGYPGDFTLIHNIYKQYTNPNPKYGNWDRFFQNQAGANAVRNRKDYFLKCCRNLESKNTTQKKVLILGSGPATDVNEYLTVNQDTKIDFTLIDFDQNAIDFAKKQNCKFNGSVEYYKINVLRYKPFKMYDLIWSAGLFDYFKDKHFIYVIQKYYKFLSNNGEFIIGNFSTSNPTRRLMEVLSDWYLNHRSRFELLKLAIEAEVKEDNIIVDSEELGVNLFLRMKAENN